MLSRGKVISVFYYVASIFLGAALVCLFNKLLYASELPDFGLLTRVLVYGAILEELLKFGLVYALYKRSSRTLVAALVGFGYGVGERLLYWSASGMFIPHDLGALCMHTCAGLSSFYFLNKYKVTSNRRDLVFALLAPIAVHGVYNIIVWLWYWWVLLGF